MRHWLSLLLGAACAAQAAPPAEIEIAYELSRNGWTIAQVVDHLRHGGGAYRLTETWEGRGLFALLGSMKRTSVGEVLAGELRPLRFADERTGRDTARAWFDWTAKTVTLRYRGEPRSEPMPPDAQDQLSSVLQLAFSPPREQPVVMHVINGRGTSTYTYRALGEERVEVPAGEFAALKLQRDKKGATVELWLAERYGFLPVRILVVEGDGTRYEQAAIRISVP